MTAMLRSSLACHRLPWIGLLLALGAVPLGSTAGCRGGAAEDTPSSPPPTADAADPAPAADDAATPASAATPAPAPNADPAGAGDAADGGEIAAGDEAAPTGDAADADADATGLRALDETQRAQLLAGAEDDPIPVDIHYIQSNETRHDLFFPYIDGIGGAIIGVGSDQTFTMAGKARSELMFMLDIDKRVVDLQRIYAVMIPQAESARALVDAFHEDAEEATKARLAEAFADLDEAHRKRILKGFLVGRETVYRHLERVISRTVNGDNASWLSDEAMFSHIQDLYRKGRVRIMVGNLAGAASMRTVGSVCTEMGVPLRVLYMSNAEEYFKYTQDFRANVASLPIDDKSVVLRTIYSKKWVHADLWAYQVQPLSDFQTRLEDNKNRSRNPMLRLAKNAGDLVEDPGPKGLTLVALSPP